MNELLQHIENKFKGIEFNEEKHLYSINGSPLNASVSGRIKQYYINNISHVNKKSTTKYNITTG